MFKKIAACALAVALLFTAALPLQAVGAAETESSVSLEEARNELADVIEDAGWYYWFNYTEESIRPMRQQLKVAQTVYNNSQATQEEVLQAAADLQAAIDGLEYTYEFYQSLLSAAIYYAEESLDNIEEYEEGAAEIITPVLEAAYKVYENPKATKEELDQMGRKLNDTLHSISYSIGYYRNELAEVIEYSETFDFSPYTKESCAPYFAAVEEGKKVLEDPDATIEEINKIYMDIDHKYADIRLTLENSRKRLKRLIEDAEWKEPDGYSAASYQSMLTVLSKAKKAYENPDATTDQLDAAFEELRDAISSDWTIEEYRRVVKECIAYAKRMPLDRYTEETLKGLDWCIEISEKTLQLPEAIIFDLQNAYFYMKDGITYLEQKNIETTIKSDLAKTIAAAEKLKPEDYTDRSAAMFLRALEDAKIALEKQEYQLEIDFADVGLQLAMERLVPLHTPLELAQAALEELLAAAPEDVGAYTEASVKALGDAVAEAKTILSDPAATQEAVEKATKNLQAAIDGLTKKTESKPEEKPDPKPEEKPSTSPQPETGGASSLPVFVFAGMALAALGCLAVQKKRKVS